MKIGEATLDPRGIEAMFSESKCLPETPGGFPPSWVFSSVFYQIFLERFANGNPRNDPKDTCRWGDQPTYTNFFGGDIEGLIEHLDYLADLGVGAIYLNPIFLAPSNHKYDTQDYLLIDPHFGNLKSFGSLLDAAHNRGIRILLDGVFNHTGDRFWAFQHVLREGARSPYTSWYHCREFPVRQEPQPNYDAWWGVSTLPKLNVANPDVLAYLTRVITFWTSLGIDGWRLDVPNEVPGFFWRYFRHLVREINPDAYLVGEIWEDGRPWLAGDMFDAVMNYQWRDLAVKFFATDALSLDHFTDGLDHLCSRYSEPVNNGLFNPLGSHDTARFLTVAGGDNRRLKLASVFQYSYPGVPVVYYGDEVGLSGQADPDCRKTMLWTPDQQDRDLLAHYRRLGRIRRSSPALWTGSFTPIHHHNQDRTWAFLREAEGEKVLTAINASPHDRTILVHPENQDESGWEDLLRGGFYETEPEIGLEVKLPAMTGTILRAR